MFEAKVNYALYHKKDVDDVSDNQVRESSAGVFGWSEAKVEQWSVGCPLIPGSTGSSMDLPPATDDDLHGESSNLTKSKDPPESTPQMSLKAYQGEIEEEGTSAKVATTDDGWWKTAKLDLQCSRRKTGHAG